MAATATSSSTGVRYAPDDPTLPKPWRGLVDSKTGYLYFWNPETNTTQYERPVSSLHANCVPSQKCLSSFMEKSLQGHHNGNDDDDDDDKINDEARHSISRYSRRSLQVLGSVGEPINPSAWRWFFNLVGDSRCPISDAWWQTETGGFMITPLPGAWPQKPGSATFPFFGIQSRHLEVQLLCD